MSERPVALVTGGSAGIGATICRQLIDRGHDVVSLARRRPDWSHPALRAIEVDLIDARATEQAAADVAKQFAISTVVHNAGVIRPALLSDVRQKDLHDLAQLHLGAAIILVQAVLPGMRERQFGRIVLISSRAALGLQTRTSYSATKAGMVGMARTWALEARAIRHHRQCRGSGPDRRHRHVSRCGAGRQRARNRDCKINPGRPTGTQR